jgi:hypothetical protein
VSYGRGDEGVNAVRADDDPRPLLHLFPSVAPAPDPDDRAVCEEQLVDGEGLTHLGAAPRRGVHEEAVEDRAPRTESASAVIGARDGAVEREGAEVEGHAPADRRQTRGRERVEETPPRQGLGAVRPENVRGDGIAGEPRPIRQQHLVPLPREQHRGGRSGAAGADDNGIVHVILLVKPMR